MSGPRRIGLIAQGGAGWMGGSEYIRNLLRAVTAAKGDQDLRLSLIHGQAQADEWQDQKGSADLVPVANRGQKRIWNRLFSANSHFIRPVNAAGLEFLYPLTYDNQYNVGVTLPLGKVSARWAGWIPDFQHRHLPQLFTSKEIKKRDKGIELLVREAPRMVFSSQSAAADFRQFFPEQAHKADVLTFATFPRADWYETFVEEDVSWLPERFFLVSNQFWKHKNHLVVFEALRLLAARGVRPVVVCTGQLQDFRDPDYANTILQSLHKMGIASQVLLLGLVLRRVQIEMMRRCLAVLQPSLFEGWSTVVEDARVLGRPCILSDIPVHKEQNPPGARFFDGHSSGDLANLLEEAWQTLSAGPNQEAEARARAQAEVRMVEVGRTFLSIAERACA